MNDDDLDLALPLVLDDDPVELEILPADFPLPKLIKFVPDARLKMALDVATASLLQLDVRGREGLLAADVARAELRTLVEQARDNFDEPVRLAYQLHAHITAARRQFTEAADAAIKSTGESMWAEKRRLDAIDAEARRREQDAADLAERARFAREADAAEGHAAPVQLVEALRVQAAETVAPPVPGGRPGAADL